MIVSAKVLSICLGLSLTAFVIATTVLAVQKANLQRDLDDAREKLNMMDKTSTSSTSVSVPSSTETTTNIPTPAPPPIDYRLPATMFPTHYDLYLNPDIALGTFAGVVKITVNVVEATNQIILHSNGLMINSMVVSNADDLNAQFEVKAFNYDSIREFFVIELSETLTTPQTIIVELHFLGSMQNKIVGLYSSSYVKPNESRKWIVTSKFEPTFARQAFPCFDEPAMKATFDITLVQPNIGDYHSLSNMDIEAEVDKGDHTEVKFKKSVPMSTYLAVFIISDFQAKFVDIDTNGIGDTFKMGVYATPEQIDKVDFALEVGKSVIEYYIKYFQIEYPLPKLDMAAIPDFVSGAMENWGLVTFRETSLLYDENVSSTANKQRIASVIAHEYAHMWFGNLVTMNWWNDLWLNEGFASYIENKGVESIYPEWDMQEQFLLGSLHGVLSLDSTLGSHPIVQTVENPDQITEIFDTITYSKGSSIIRMLEDFISPAKFQEAVTNYLNEFKYKNAVTDDFLTEIDKLNLGFDIKQIMGTWTEQMGLPVVNVEQSGNTFKLTQKRFFSNPDDYNGIYTDSKYNYTWDIPITYQINSQVNEVRRAWFYHDQAELTIDVPAGFDWVKFNYDQVGYYRVNYETNIWQKFATQLINDPMVFSTSDRAGLLNDVFSLADATQVSYDIALDMTQYLNNEIHYVPWSVASSKLLSLKRSLMFTETFIDYSHYAQQLVRPMYEELTWNVNANNLPNQHLLNRLRVTAISSACSLGLQACLTEAANQFNTWLANPSVRPHPDLREIIYFYGMAEGGNEETWQNMWQLFITEEDASEKSKLMYGLSAVQIPWILSRYIQLAWNEEYVRGQDYFTCLQYIASNPIGESIVWDYVRENWDRLVARFGLNERYLGNLIPSITGRFATQTKLEEMEYFFDKNPEAGAGAAARVRALENVKNNIVWLENNRDIIAQWLTAHKTENTRVQHKLN